MSTARIFISYAREDANLVRQIYTRLSTEGFRPWLDTEEILPGQDWDRAITKALRQADFIMVCLSSRSVAKRGYLQKEFKQAMDQWSQMLSDDIYLIPVRLDECKVPEQFNSLQWVDYSRADGWRRIQKSISAGIVHRALDQRAEEDQTRKIGSTSHLGLGRISAIIPQIRRRVQSLPDFAAPGGLRKVLILLQSVPATTFGKLALALLATGNLALLLGSMRPFIDQLFDWFGYTGLRMLDMGMVVLVTSFLILGYLCGLAWLLTALPRIRSSGARRLAGLTLVVFLTAICVANVRMGMPPRPEMKMLLEEQLGSHFASWKERIFAFQAPSGGIRGGPSADAKAQVWTTAQSLVGVVSAVSRAKLPQTHRDEIRAAFNYIESARSFQSGGGWGYWDNSLITVTEVTAWVVLAYARSLDPAVREFLWSPIEQDEVRLRIERDISILLARQSHRGGWRPVADATGESDTRTYSTVMALWALVEASAAGAFSEDLRGQADESIKQGLDWLLNNYLPELGWVPNPNRGAQTERFPGLTAQVLFVLGRAATDFAVVDGNLNYLAARDNFLSDKEVLSLPLEANSRLHDADQHLPTAPEGFLIEASTFLWHPWTFAVLGELADSTSLDRDSRKLAKEHQLALALRGEELDRHVRKAFLYETAENLFGVSWGLPQAPRER